MSFCNKCGQELSDNAKYCKVCGCSTGVEHNNTSYSQQNVATYKQKDVVSKLSILIKVGAVICVLVGVCQIISLIWWLGYPVFFPILIGVIDIVIGIQEFCYSNIIKNKPIGIVKRYKPKALIILNGVYNFIFGITLLYFLKVILLSIEFRKMPPLEIFIVAIIALMLGIIIMVYGFIVRRYVLKNAEAFNYVEKKYIGLMDNYNENDDSIFVANYGIRLTCLIIIFILFFAGFLVYMVMLQIHLFFGISIFEAKFWELLSMPEYLEFFEETIKDYPVKFFKDFFRGII